MATAVSLNSLTPRKPIDCYIRNLSFHEDFVTIGSPKRVLEPYEDQSFKGEPETKRLCQSKLPKPSECSQCGSLFLDAKKLKQHQKLHTADAVLLSWLGQDKC